MSTMEIALITLAVTILLGMPIFMSLIIASSAALLLGDSMLPLSVIHNSLFEGINLFTLLAIPCFVVAGSLMEYGNITRQIIDVAKMLVGRMYGGLGITTILACTFFAAISGSGPGTVAAVGAIMVPAMMTMEIPLPMPLTEIWSPIQTRNIVPAVKMVEIYSSLAGLTPPTIRPG